MARRWLLLAAGILAVGCVSVTSQPTAPTIATPVVIATPPTLSPIDTPKSTPTPQPIDTPAPTAPPVSTPTSEPVPTPTQEPERTLAPGETPTASPMDISELLTSTMSVTNLTDAQVSASVDLFNEGEKVGTVAKLDIEPYGSLLQNVPAATYLVSITVGSAAPVTCEVTIAEQGEVDFAVVETDILVTGPDAAPTAPDDIFIESSPLCA
jgi:hypothetical protein